MTKRRGQNEGSIYKRADGRWAASLTLPNGKRKAYYGKARAEVAEKLAVALGDVQRGILPPAERQTVARFLDCWLTDSVKATVRPRTFASYSQLVRTHIAPAFGRRPLARLGPQEVQAFLNAKLADGLSPRTVQYLHAVLRRALGQALKWGLVARNVAILVDPPRVVRPEVQPLTPEAAKVLLEAARGDRLVALYTVALSLGLRQGELLGLRWQDVDLDNGFLHVRRALQRIDGKLRLVEPKTARSRRTVALPAFVAAALREHQQRQALERMFVGEGWQDWSLVFTTAIGTPLDARNAVRSFKGLLAKAGLPDMRFHDLRHSCASLLLAQGLSLRAIMEVLGHSQIALTANTYSHILPQMQREAADAMDRLLG